MLCLGVRRLLLLRFSFHMHVKLDKALHLFFAQEQTNCKLVSIKPHKLCLGSAQNVCAQPNLTVTFCPLTSLSSPS